MDTITGKETQAAWQIELERVLAAQEAVRRMLHEAEDLELDCGMLRAKLKHLRKAVASFRSQDIEAGREHLRLALGD